MKLFTLRKRRLVVFGQQKRRGRKNSAFNTTFWPCAPPERPRPGCPERTLRGLDRRPWRACGRPERIPKQLPTIRMHYQLGIDRRLSNVTVVRGRAFMGRCQCFGSVPVPIVSAILCISAPTISWYVAYCRPCSLDADRPQNEFFGSNY